MIRFIIIVIVGLPSIVFGQDIKCPKGYQPYANRCITQRMADYISCIEASGHNQQEIIEEFADVTGQKAGIGARGSGSGAIFKGSGSFTLDKASEKNLAKRIEKRWFPNGMSECSKVLDKKTIDDIRRETSRTRKIQEQMLEDQKKREAAKKSYSLFVVPNSLEISPGYSRKSSIKIVNNQDFPVYQVDLKISIERGDLSIDDINLNPIDKPKLEFKETGVSFDVFMIGMITEEGKRENHMYIYDIDAHSTKEFMAEINANKFHQQSKIVFEIVRYDKQPGEVISWDPFISCKSDDKNFETYHKTSITMLEQKRFKEALLCCEKAIRKDPRSAKAYSNMGVALLFLNEWERAIQKFEKAIEIDPKSAKSYLNLAGAYIQQKKCKEAEEKLKIVASVEGPEQKDALVLWGQCRELQNDKEGAVNKYKRATELDPGFGKAYYAWGILHKNNGDCENAIKKFEKAVLCNDDVRLNSYGMWGACLEKLGRHKEAIEKYEKIIKLAPKSVAASRSKNSINQLKK